MNLNWNNHYLALYYTLIYCFIQRLDTNTSTITLNISFLDRCLVQSVPFHNNDKLLSVKLISNETSVSLSSLHCVLLVVLTQGIISYFGKCNMVVQELINLWEHMNYSAGFVFVLFAQSIVSCRPLLVFCPFLFGLALSRLLIIPLVSSKCSHYRRLVLWLWTLISICLAYFIRTKL